MLLLGLAVTVTASPRTARAEEAATPEVQQAEMEITESVAGQPARSVRLLFGLSEWAPSKISTQTGPTSYQVTLWYQTRKGARPLVRCDLDRYDSQANRTQHQRLQSSTSAAPGHRVTLGRIVNPDGARLEVTLLLR